MMRVHVNGEEREVEDGLTLAALLDFLKVEKARVAVEVNAEIVRRALHAQTTLKSGDQIEIVTFVGGG
jgi:sulfur carrier protein